MRIVSLQSATIAKKGLIEKCVRNTLQPVLSAIKDIISWHNVRKRQYILHMKRLQYNYKYQSEQSKLMPVNHSIRYLHTTGTYMDV